MFRRLSYLQNQTIAVRAAALALAVAAVCLPAALVAGLTAGPAGAIGCVAAALACLIGATGALLLGHFFRGTSAAIWGPAAGMIARMAAPLGSAAAYTLIAPRSAGAGPLLCLLFFYPVTTVLEIVLSMPSGGAGR